MTTINWADIMSTADDREEELPDGDYIAVAARATARTSANGNEMVTVFLEAAGKSVPINIMLSRGPVAALTPARLEALGLSIADLAARDATPQQIAELVTGQRVQISVGSRSHNGSRKAEVTRIARLESQA